MSRRIQIGLIALVVVLAVVGFGGGFDLSFGGTAEEDRSTSPSTMSSTSSPYSDAQFQNELDKANVSAGGKNVSLEANKRRLIASGSLTYVTDARSIAGMRKEAKQVAATYARAVENGYARANLYVSVTDGDGNKVGSYAIRRAWALAYNQDEFSVRAYNQRVIQTGTFLDPVTPTPTTATAGASLTAPTKNTAPPPPRTTATPPPTQGPSEGYTDTEFRAALEDAGIDIDYLQADRQAQDAGSATGSLIVEYTTTTTTTDTRREEVGVVAEVYAQAVADGYQRTPLYVTVYDETGRPVADFRIERAWALAYAQDDLSAEEYGERIGRTYRSFVTLGSSASDTSTELTPTATTPPLEPNETDTMTEPDTDTEAGTETSEERDASEGRSIAGSQMPVTIQT